MVKTVCPKCGHEFGTDQQHPLNAVVVYKLNSKVIATRNQHKLPAAGQIITKKDDDYEVLTVKKGKGKNYEATVKKLG